MKAIPIGPLAATLLLWPATTHATTLTLKDALARARERAPAILAARTRVDEARGRLGAASVLLRDNPVVEALAGRRMKNGNDSTDREFRAGQVFELGGRRSARIAGAAAGLVRATASTEDDERRVLRDVATAFLRTLASARRLELLRSAAAVDADLLGAARRRHAAGDIADLDLNLVRIAAARARADVGAAEAALGTAEGELRTLLGMEAQEPLGVSGELDDRASQELEPLLASARERADLRALAAEVEEAEAEARLGRASRWPDLGLQAVYKEEEGAQIPGGGLSLTLPIFARGQELQATASVRARRLRLELEAGRRAAEAEVRTAFAVHRRLVDAARELEREAVAVLDANDDLARRSYEAGQVSLPDFLLLRRGSVEVRLEQVDRALEAALAAVELGARAGVLR